MPSAIPEPDMALRSFSVFLRKTYCHLSGHHAGPWGLIVCQDFVTGEATQCLGHPTREVQVQKRSSSMPWQSLNLGREQLLTMLLSSTLYLFCCLHAASILVFEYKNFFSKVCLSELVLCEICQDLQWAPSMSAQFSLHTKFSLLLSRVQLLTMSWRVAHTFLAAPQMWQRSVQ